MLMQQQRCARICVRSAKWHSFNAIMAQFLYMNLNGRGKKAKLRAGFLRFVDVPKIIVGAHLAQWHRRGGN
jgi:hypothetical protein